jgi:hypothetical protein
MAQLYLSKGDILCISTGEQLYINGDMNVQNGAVIINHSVANIDLSGTASINGEIDYCAAGDQSILPFNHQTLRIGGSGNKLLLSAINIGSSIQLGGSAKLVTGGNILSLASMSCFIGGVPAFGNSASSWIVTGNGSTGAGNTGLGGLKMAAIGPGGHSGTELFPVGPTPYYYNPITVSNTGVTDDFTVSVNDQVVPGAPLDESVKATWLISESVAGGSNVSLGTQWNSTDESNNFVRAASAIVHSDGTKINYFAGDGPAVGTNPYTQTGSGFTAFSPFGVTSNAKVLPVNFISIKGYRKGGLIQVDWKIAAEENIQFYEVQKSTTGSNFKLAGKVMAAGNNNFQLSYGWPDLNPANGSNFYRVRGVSATGAYIYSSIVKVNFDAGISFISIYPNPVTNNKMALEFNNQKAGIYNITIISSAGAIVFKNKIIHSGANSAYTMQLPATLAREAYEMNIDGPGNTNKKLQLVIHN